MKAAIPSLVTGLILVGEDEEGDEAMDDGDEGLVMAVLVLLGLLLLLLLLLVLVAPGNQYEDWWCCE